MERPDECPQHWCESLAWGEAVGVRVSEGVGVRVSEGVGEAVWVSASEGVGEDERERKGFERVRLRMGLVT